MKLSRENIGRLPSPKASFFKEGSVTSASVSNSQTSRSSTATGQSAFRGGEWTAKAKENLREAYNSFERGKITGGKLRNMIENDIGIKITPEFEKTMETVDKTFADIVRSLNANASKTPSGIKSAINPLLGSFHRYKKCQTEHQKPEKMTPREKVVESLKGLLEGKISQETFLDDLREQNVNTDNIEKEINRFKASNQGHFREFGVKIMRELKSMHEGFGVDAPHNTSRDLLGTAKESLFLHQIHHDFNDEKLDAVKKRCQIRYVMTNDGKPIYCETRSLAPETTRAKLTNGNIITWEDKRDETKIREEDKNQEKKKYHVHRDKQQNILVGFQYHPYSESTDTIVPQRKKNLALHTKSHNFIGW